MLVDDPSVFLEVYHFSAGACAYVLVSTVLYTSDYSWRLVFRPRSAVLSLQGDDTSLFFIKRNVERTLRFRIALAAANELYHEL